MFIFKIIRKIGRMLRGGAGKKEIMLGAMLGVLIGFNPTSSLTLFLATLVALLLNGNFGFTMLGVAVGKLASLLIAPISFHTGFFLIHKIGLEGLFTKLANAPVTALMDLDVYAMIGSLPYAIVIGIAFGLFMSATVTRIREQMVRAGEHEKVGKVAGNKVAKFLMWLVFGKQKVSTADVLVKQSPLFRKSGIILVAVVLVVGLVLQFLLADILLKKGLETAIASATGAEANIEKADLNLGGGKVEILNLEVTDPDKPTHNMVQIEQLAADISMGDLLRKTYTIDLLSGSVLKTDVPRESPGKVYAKEKKAEEEEAAADETGGKPLDAYLAKAKKWKEYGAKANEYLEKYQQRAEAKEQGEQPEPSKETAVADAKKAGYLKARADLVADRPEWTIRKVEIDNVDLGNAMPLQKLEGAELSSHPALNAKASSISITPVDGTEPTAKIVMRFDDPSAANQIVLNLKNIDIADQVKTGERLSIESGMADISAEGSFSSDTLDIPFTLDVRELKTNNETINNLKQIEIPGKLYGTLRAPRVKVDIGDNLKNAVVGAAKEKAKEEAKKAAEQEVNKALESEEAQDIKNKAGDALKKLF